MAFSCYTIGVPGQCLQVGQPPLRVFLQVFILFEVKCFLHLHHSLRLYHPFAGIPPTIWASRLQFFVRWPGLTPLCLLLLLEDEAYLIDGVVAPGPVDLRFDHGMGLRQDIAGTQLYCLI